VAKTRRPVKKRSAKPARKAARPKAARATAKKTRASKSASKPARKSARRSTRGSAAAAEPRVLSLKHLRGELALALSALSKRQARSAAAAPKLDSARERISQWMTDIDDICSDQDHEVCGPDMAFPLP
jgi:hypothetical protein